MRVFVTGATGFVGSAVVTELLGAGHQVLGLVRSDAAAAALARTGAQVHRGTLGDLESLRRGAAEADAVVHTAFNHDFSQFMANCEEDRVAIEAMGEVLAGSDRPLIVTSGVAMLANGRLATEADRPPTTFPRKSEAAAEAAAERNARTCAIRLSPSTHGQGDHGFVPILIGIAREKGVSAYVGDGNNRWPGVHRFDAARLYRLALEHGGQGGPFHAVADEGVKFRDLAEVIGAAARRPGGLQNTGREAGEHFGWFGMFTGADLPASSERTRQRLGWTPREIGLLADIDQPYYFGG